MAHSTTRILTVFALAGTLLATATACAPETPTAESTPTASSSAPEPTPSTTAANENPGTPINLSCSELVSPQAMYDFNPNFGINPTLTPAPGSQGAITADYNGLTCIWVNESSGETITVAAADLPADLITGIANDLLATSNSVPTYDAEGYFQLVGNVGEAEVVSGSYWVTATSTAFFEPGDAAPVIAAALSGLGL
jgi:hypothetical protein